MFDNISDLDLGRWICTPRSTSLCCSCQSASQEKHGRLHIYIFQHQSTGYLRTRGQEALYETCAFNIDLSLFKTSQRLRTTTYRIPEGTGDFMRSESCAHVIHTNLYTLSPLIILFDSNVCVGYMCFVKL